MKLSQRRMTAPSLGGMLATRQGSLMLALLCAVIAACVLVFALGRFKSNVAQPIPQATVLVASGEIQKGTTGAEMAAAKLYRAMPVAVSELSEGAVTNAATIANSTASTDILPGQQLTAAEFGTISGVDTVLRPGYRGVEISVGEASGATDIAQAGDHVDIWATGGTMAKPGQGNAGETPLASGVLVLKPATPAVVDLGNKTVPGSELVIALKASQVGKIIAENGALYLALDPSSTGPSVITPTSASGGN